MPEPVRRIEPLQLPRSRAMRMRVGLAPWIGRRRVVVEGGVL